MRTKTMFLCSFVCLMATLLLFGPYTLAQYETHPEPKTHSAGYFALQSLDGTLNRIAVASENNFNGGK